MTDLTERVIHAAKVRKGTLIKVPLGRGPRSDRDGRPEWCLVERREKWNAAKVQITYSWITDGTKYTAFELFHRAAAVEVIVSTRSYPSRT